MEINYMKVPAIDHNKMTFGAIILRDERSFSKEICDIIEEKTKGRKGGGFKSESLADKRLIDEVIKYDFNTPKLQEQYKRLVLSQEKNPVNIYIDLYTADKNEIPLHPSGWFQKATVGTGSLKKTFKQATTYVYTSPSPIKFLKKACLYADILNFLKLGR